MQAKMGLPVLNCCNWPKDTSD